MRDAIQRAGVVIAGPVLGRCQVTLAGPDWAEIGDAGSFLGTAQAPTGIGGANLNSISGHLTGGFFQGPGDFEDMYIIRITDPATFSCTVGTANFNSQLFLFNITLPGAAYGLLANDDQSGSDNRPRMTNVATDGTGLVVDLPGDYLLAITGFNNDPLSSTGPIFNQASLTEVSGPDGIGGFNRHIAWQGGGETGEYTIQLTGAGFPNFPAPGSLVLLALGAVPAMRRRR